MNKVFLIAPLLAVCLTCALLRAFAEPPAAANPSAANPVVLNLWSGFAPGETTSSLGNSSTDTTGQYGPITKLVNITQPQIIFYAAAGRPRARLTVLVLPGGGYYVVTTDIEGAEIAHWLNTLGYNAAVLHYRVSSSAVPSPARRIPALQDAQRAMSLLRAEARTLGIDPLHLGIIGFSAGGHLAARMAAGHDPRAYPSSDAFDRISFRPDFALLIYPAYLWDKAAGMAVPEAAPSAGMPPLFLMQTRDDGLLDADVYTAAAKEAGVNTECLIYDTGGHGYGLRLSERLPAHEWPEKAAAWIRQQAMP